MFLQNVDSLFDIVWTETPQGKLTYGDVFLQNEREMSAFNFEYANIDFHFQAFNHYEDEATKLIDAELPLAAYEMVLKASHSFNLLDARQAISVTERQRYILRVRKMAFAVAKNFYEKREALGFPLLKQNHKEAL